LDVTLDAEDQGDVDVRALRDHRLDRGQPRGSGRDLDHHVRPCDAPLQVARRGDRELCVTGDFARDLDADEPVSAVLTLVDRTQVIGGGLHVLDQQVPHGRLGLLPCVETPGHLVGVGVRALQRPGEDRRVRGDAADSGVAVPGQLPGADHSAVDLVEPHALAQALQFGDRIGLVHVVPHQAKLRRSPVYSHTRSVGEQNATDALRALMPLAATLGMRAEAFTADQVVLALDWSPSLCTSGGALHGGVIMALADSAGGACAMLNLPAEATGTTTIESKTNFMGAARRESVS